MKLVTDEGIDRQIVETLRSDGHEVDYLAEMATGISDEEVLHLARSCASLLLTQDKDFGELVLRQGIASSGVLLIRLAGEKAEEKSRFVSEAIRDRGDELSGAFSVLTANTLGIRRM